MKPVDKTSALCAILLLIVAAGTAAAGNDAVQATVTIPAGQPTPILKLNGSGLTPGNYAIGTIQLYYTVQGFQFPTGLFATFNLGLGIAGGTSSSDYPVPLALAQTGSSDVLVTPLTSTFTAGSVLWADNTLVTISIPPGITNVHDGDEIVGNLQIAQVGQHHMNTTTTIQVHIKLVFPTACLKLYDFITDESLTTTLTSTDVNVNTRKGTVTSTNPFGSLSDNVLVVNTCSVAKSFDVRITLDSWFRTNPSDNPGNAVLMFTTAGEVDPETFFSTAFGTGAPQGQALDFTNVTLEAGHTLLLTVHMAIKKGDIWNGGASGTFAGFRAGLYESGTGFVTLLSDVLPGNPATVSVGYTMK